MGPAPTGGQYQQAEVNYRPGDGATNCGACRHFDGQGSCDIVAGPIRPDGVSDLFEPAPQGLDQLGGQMSMGFEV